MRKKCPVCNSNRFYIKDPEDAYEMYEFSIQGGEVVFEPGEEDANPPGIGDETETYCNQCSWHGKFRTL